MVMNSATAVQQRQWTAGGGERRRWLTAQLTAGVDASRRRGWTAGDAHPLRRHPPAPPAHHPRAAVPDGFNGSCAGWTVDQKAFLLAVRVDHLWSATLRLNPQSQTHRDRNNDGGRKLE